MITGVDLFGFSVRDKAKAIAFYRDVLGLETTDEDEQSAEFTLADGTTFGIWRPGTDEYPLGGGVMFAVSDIENAVEHFRGRGAVLSDVMETRVCFMSFGNDPDGNHFIIHQRKNRD